MDEDLYQQTAADALRELKRTLRRMDAHERERGAALKIANRAGWTVKDLATMCQVTRGTIYRWMAMSSDADQ